MIASWKAAAAAAGSAAERMARTLAVGVPEAVERGVDLADDVVIKTRDVSQIHRDPVLRAINASWGA